MWKGKRIFCGILTAIVLLAGCAPAPEPAPITVALTDDLVSLDAAGTKDVISETVARCVYATLYTFDENLNLIPCLAESGERLSDLEWEFHLRENAKFHDGSPLTSEDVKYSLERAMSIELAEKSLLIIERIETPDPYTVKVFTKEPCADLSSVFVRVSTSVMSKKALEKPDYDFNQPVGSGPFRVLERKEGSLKLERFDDYFLEPARTKYLDFIVEPSEQNRTAALLNKQYDVVLRISSADCDYLKLNDQIKVYQHQSTKMELMQLNPAQKPLDDIRVRQAILYAIDRQNIVDNVADGYGKVLNSMLPEPLLGAADFEGFTYDPQLAKKLLEEAGYADGFDLTVLTFDMLRKQEMEYMKLDLAKVGIRLNYEFLELADYLEVVERGDHLATIMGWTCNQDPDSTFSQLYSKNGHVTVNQSGFSDERVEQLILEGKKESDSEKRAVIYGEANHLVAESYYVLPLYQPDVLVAAGSGIEGVRVNPQGLFGYESLYRVTEKS